MKEDYIDYGIHIGGLHSNNSSEIYTTCPICSHTRKKKSNKCLSVNIEKGIWICHHCGWSGCLKNKDERWKITEKHFGKSIISSTNIEEKKVKTEVLSEEAIKYFMARGISKETLVSEKIFGATKFVQAEGKRVGVIAFPYYMGEKLVNVKYRDKKKNFLQEPNPERIPYRMNHILNQDDIYITEGEMDAITLVECGVDNVCSIPDGAPDPHAKNFTSKFDFLNYIEDSIGYASRIFLLMDNDDPGHKAEEELVRRIGREKCYHFEYPPGCKDANDVLKEFGKDGVARLLSSPIEYPIRGIYSVDDLYEGLVDLYEHGYGSGVSTGWGNLDRLFKVRTREFTVVTGVPGSGKSEFVTNLATNLFKLHGWGMTVCSPESLPLERYLSIVIEKLALKPFTRGPHERISRKELDEYVNKLRGNIHLLHLDDDEMTMNNLLDLIRVTIFRHGIKLAIIDPFNELDVDPHLGMTETQYIEQCLTKARRFARLNNIHLIIVAHPKKLQRDKEGKFLIPDLYSINGSAAWKNKADNGIVVHRNRKKDQLENTVDILVQKIRFRDIGIIGECRMKFCWLTATYEPYDGPDDDMVQRGDGVVQKEARFLREG